MTFTTHNTPKNILEWIKDINAKVKTTKHKTQEKNSATLSITKGYFRCDTKKHMPLKKNINKPDFIKI